MVCNACETQIAQPMPEDRANEPAGDAALRRSPAPHWQDCGAQALAYKRGKRARTAPARFETMIEVPRGGTMRVRIPEERLM